MLQALRRGRWHLEGVEEGLRSFHPQIACCVVCRVQRWALHLCQLQCCGRGPCRHSDSSDFQAIRGVASMGKPNSSPYHGRCVFSTVLHGAGIYFHFLNHTALFLSSHVFNPNWSGAEECHSCPAGCSQLMNKQIYAKAGQHSALTCFQCFYSCRSQIFLKTFAVRKKKTQYKQLE